VAPEEVARAQEGYVEAQKLGIAVATPEARRRPPVRAAMPPSTARGV